MSNKKQPSSQANLLRADGTPALGKTHVNKTDINPIGFYKPDITKYNQIWTNYDLNQYCSTLVWENLPNGLDSWLLMRMLYYRGTLCAFKAGGKVYILPYNYIGGLNCYGMPTQVMPLTFNGRSIGGSAWQRGFDLPVDIEGNDTTDYDAVLLFDSVPLSTPAKSPSRYAINQIIIDEISDTLARININIVVSNKKILLVVKDPAQADVVRKELETIFSSDCPFGIITSEMETNSIQSTSDFNADELFNTVKNWDAIRCFMSGIASKNFGTEKKERLVSGELAGNEEQIDLIADMRLYLAQKFCERVNKKFGTNITVRLRSDDYEDETNGNNKNKQQEEEEL